MPSFIYIVHSRIQMRTRFAEEYRLPSTVARSGTVGTIVSPVQVYVLFMST